MRTLLALCTLFLLAVPSAQAQMGALYRCSAVEYTNMLSASEAQARQCAKIGNAEWVVAASDAAGNTYEYHDRRTVFRPNGSIETSSRPACSSNASRIASLRRSSMSRCAERPRS